MSGESKITVNHDEIRRWTEERGGAPAAVRGTEEDGPEALRIKFAEEENLEGLEWKDFFDRFEKNNLAMIYQDDTPEGEQSRFFKFIHRPGTMASEGG